MRKLQVFFFVLALCVASSPAHAWEVTLTGTFTSEYRYLTQMGTNGFFGPYDLIAPAGASEAPNLFTGIHFSQISGRLISSSSDVATHGMWADFDPEIRINQAIRLRGRYRIGREDWGNINLDPIYYNSIYGGVNRKFTDGGWSMFWATAQTPWGILAVGKRPFAFGCGLMFDGTITTTTESVLIVAPYGPFRFLFGFYPARSTGASFNQADKTHIETWEYAPVMTYSQGPLELGTFWDYITLHLGPEGGLSPTTDAYILFTTHYLKYNNGCFFTNAEFSTYDRGNKFTGSRPTYIENTRWMIESGFMAGPMKVSNIYAAVTGGFWGDKTYNVYALHAGGVPGTSNSALGNTVVFKPYSLLMIRNYGGGTSFDSLAYEGSLDNAWFLGSRVDYAIAANLNMWTAVSGAWRLDRSSNSWGYVRPSIGPFGQVGYALAPGAPRFIPNDDIGWEVYGGIDWKLLEGLRVTAEGAWFEPGLWWRHATPSSIDPAGVANTFVELTAPSVANGALNPFRTIDPIVAFYVSCYWEF